MADLNVLYKHFANNYELIKLLATTSSGLYFTEKALIDERYVFINLTADRDSNFLRKASTPSLQHMRYII
jgi:hypothetical protein